MLCCKPTRRRRSAYLLAAILVCVVVYGSLFVLLPPTERSSDIQISSRSLEAHEEVLNGREILNLKRKAPGKVNLTVYKQSIVKFTFGSFVTDF